MMLETKLQAANALAAASIAALGFVAPWPIVVTGILFALAGGFAGMVVSPPLPEERMGLAGTLFVAVTIGLLVGLAHPHFANFGPTAWIAALPLQLVMGCAGIGSRWIAKRAATGDFSLPWKRGGDNV